VVLCSLKPENQTRTAGRKTTARSICPISTENHR
jgi:hypothetical protein